MSVPSPEGRSVSPDTQPHDELVSSSSPDVKCEEAETSASTPEQTLDKEMSSMHSASFPPQDTLPEQQQVLLNPQDNSPIPDSKDKPIECQVCGVSFSDPSKLDKHSLVHSGVDSTPKDKQMYQSRPFMCDICEETFIRESDLQQHKQSCNSRESYDCEVCKKAFFTEGALKKHKIKHVLEQPYLCGVCLQSFRTTKLLKAHMINHVGTGNSSACDACSEEFPDTGSLRKHQEICKKKPSQSESGTESSANSQHTVNSQKNAEVSGNQTRGQDMSHLGETVCITLPWTHLVESLSTDTTSDKQDPIDPPVPNQLSEQVDFPDEATSSDAPNKRTELTGSDSVTASGLSAFRCEICEKMFYSSNVLEAHRRSCSCHVIETSTRRHVTEELKTTGVSNDTNLPACTDDDAGLPDPTDDFDEQLVEMSCTEVFSPPKDPGLHSESNPEMSNAHHLDPQGSMTGNDSLSSVHQLFTSKTNKQIVVNKIQFYTCGVCNKDFKGRAELILHKLSHPEATSGCASKRSLQQPPGVSASRKPATCKYCNKVFPYPARMLEHERIHTKDKPFNCDRCDKSFAQRGVLVRHLKDVHKNAFSLSESIKHQSYVKPSENTPKTDASTTPSSSQKIQEIDDRESLSIRSSERNFTESSSGGTSQSVKALEKYVELPTCSSAPIAKKSPTITFVVAQEQPVLLSTIKPELRAKESSARRISVKAHDLPVNLQGLIYKFLAKECRNQSQLSQHKQKHTEKLTAECDKSSQSSPQGSLKIRHDTSPPSSSFTPPATAQHEQNHTEKFTAECDKSSQSSSQASSKNLQDTSPSSSSFTPPAKAQQVPKEKSPYTCRYCGKICSQWYLLIRHLKSHSDERPHKCDLCLKPFKYKHNLRTHKVKCSQKNQPQTAPSEKLPGNSGSSQTAASDVQGTSADRTPPALKTKTPEDQKTCSGGSEQVAEMKKPFTCRYCWKVCSHRSRLVEHERVHTKEKPYKCDVCDRSFGRGSNLRSHMKRLHAKLLPRKKQQRPSRADSDPKDSTPTAEKPPANSHPNLSAPSEDQQTPPHDNPPASDETTFDQPPEKLQQKEGATSGTTSDKLPEESQQSVAVPEASEDKSSSLDESKQAAKTKNLFICKFCGKVCDHRSRLVEHIRSHTKEKPFKCENCEQSFSQESSLRNHMKNHHGVVFPIKKSEGALKCNICGNLCSKQSALWKHLRSHSNDRPFSCECLRSFKYKHTLKAHKIKCTATREAERNSDGETSQTQGAETYEDIATSFGELRQMPRMRTRDAHTCRFCGKVCISRSILMEHERTHTREKPYKCEICNKSYSQTCALKNHMLRAHDKTLDSERLKVLRPTFKAEIPPSVYSEWLSRRETDDLMRLFCCNDCDRRFLSRNHLNDHYIRMHTDIREYTCRSCNKGFCKKVDLARHERIHFQDQDGGTSVDASLQPDSGNKVSDVTNCRLCQENFGSATELKIHIDEYHKGISPQIHACPKCSETFLVCRDLKKHFLDTHANLRPFRCRFCSKDFKTYSEFLGHEKTHQITECSLCGLKHQEEIRRESKFSWGTINTKCKSEFTRALRRHKLKKQVGKNQASGRGFSKKQSGGRYISKNQTGGRCFSKKQASGRCFSEKQVGDRCIFKFQCSTCAGRFSKMSHFKLHMKIHKRGKEEPIYCDLCGKHFKSLTSLRRHRLMFHSGRNGGGKDVMKCEKCQEELPDKSALISHLRTVHSTSTPYSCEGCHASFPTSLRLRTHKQITHPGGKMKLFVCTVCHIGFQWHYLLSYHLRKHFKNPEEQHVCPLCQKSFKGVTCLLAHKLSEHGPRKYMCDICGKLFNSLTSFRNHQRLHSDKYNFICDRCGRCFKTRKNLKQHNKYPCNGSSTYACHICNKTFKTNGFLTRHITTHRDRRKTCQVCKKVFPTQKRLTEHMRMHTSKRPYKCKFCSQTFRHRVVMLSHQNIHTGEKPYKCKICGDAFARHVTLLSHERVHKKENSKRKSKR